MINWIRRRMLREGKVVVSWPACDLREDRLVVDLSRVDQNIVGIQRRQYNVLRQKDSPPLYPETVEYILLNELWSLGTPNQGADRTDEPLRGSSAGQP
jgi:hypothetical protein